MFVFSGTRFAEHNVEHLKNVTFRISAMTKSGGTTIKFSARMLPKCTKNPSEIHPRRSPRPLLEQSGGAFASRTPKKLLSHFRFGIPFSTLPFGAPFSFKWGAKMSIVTTRVAKKVDFGLHFGTFLGSGCKSENRAAVETGTLLTPSRRTPKASKKEVYF